MYTYKTIKPILYLFIATFILISPDYSFSQCVPDTTCEDIGDPGQICPDSLPDGTIGDYYEHTVTILPPKTAMVAGGTHLIVKIILDTITNFPTGLTYQASAKELYPNIAYCAKIEGTPTVAGNFPLEIKVIPFISYQGFIIAGDTVVNDTSLAITIHAASNVESMNYSGFKLDGEYELSGGQYYDGTLYDLDTFQGTLSLKKSAYTLSYQSIPPTEFSNRL